MATLKNTKPRQGMTLHKWVATGGKPKDRKNCADYSVQKAVVKYPDVNVKAR